MLDNMLDTSTLYTQPDIIQNLKSFYNDFLDLKLSLPRIFLEIHMIDNGEIIPLHTVCYIVFNN